MLIGVWLHVTKRHKHQHVHEPLNTHISTTTTSTTTTTTLQAILRANLMPIATNTRVWYMRIRITQTFITGISTDA